MKKTQVLYELVFTFIEHIDVTRFMDAILLSLFQQA